MSRLAPAATAADLQLDGTNLTLVYVVLAIAVIALVMGAFFRREVLAADPGTDKMQEIGAAVEEGAQAYLARQFKTEWLAIKKREKEKNAESEDGPSYYVVRRHRLGSSLLRFVSHSLEDGSLTPSKAARVLGVKARSVAPLISDAPLRRAS